MDKARIVNQIFYESILHRLGSVLSQICRPQPFGVYKRSQIIVPIIVYTTSQHLIDFIHHYLDLSRENNNLSAQYKKIKWL